MKNSLNLKISTIGAALALTSCSSPLAVAIEPESPRRKTPLSSRSRRVVDDANTSISETDTCNDDELTFEVEIKTDKFSASDNFWSIVNKDNNEVIAAGECTDKEDCNLNECLPACGDYEFSVYDRFGDGLTAAKENSTYPSLRATLDDEEVMVIGEHDAKSYEFAKESYAFTGGDKCTAMPVSQIVVNDGSTGRELCLQPANFWKEQYRIVAKPCTEKKKAQLWSVDYMGQWHNAINEDFCLFRNKSQLFVKKNCADEFGEKFNSNFIYNSLEGTMHLFGNNMKVFQYNRRDGTMWIRDIATPEANARPRQQFLLRKDYLEVAGQKKSASKTEDVLN